MKDFYIGQSVEQENKVITSSFVVVAKQIRAKKSGEPYLALTLADRTGQIEAKMWDNVEDCLNGFEQDDFLKVRGTWVEALGELGPRNAGSAVVMRG